jgi:hypothetical protein
MRRVAGMIFIFLCFSLGPIAAQSPQYRRAMPAQEECPQGRQIREQQGFYPSTMTDCQVLDADTAVENQKLKRKRGAPMASPLPKPRGPEPGPPPAARAIPAAAPVAQPQTGEPALGPPAERPLVAESQHADYDGRIIGNWMVSAKQDRFGDGGAFVAMTGDGAVALAVRCLQKDLSIGVIELGDDPKPMEKGDVYELKFRVDTQPIVDAEGIAISERLIQVETEKSLVKSMRDGKETALRLEDGRGVSSTHIFNTKGSRAAFADLSRECPLD